MNGWIDAKQQLELNAAFLKIVQEDNVVLLVTELDDRVGISRVDAVQHRHVVRGLGRHALVENNFQARIRVLNELAQGTGQRSGEIVGGVEHGDPLDAETSTVVSEKIGKWLRPNPV